MRNEELETVVMVDAVVSCDTVVACIAESSDKTILHIIRQLAERVSDPIGLKLLNALKNL